MNPIKEPNPDLSACENSLFPNSSPMTAPRNGPRIIPHGKKKKTDKGTYYTPPISPLTATAVFTTQHWSKIIQDL